MKVSAKGGDFPQCPAGSHVAVCVRCIDIGTQTGEYQGQETKRRQVVLSFEIPDEIVPDGHGESSGKPFLISKFYTASIGDKANLRKDLIAWRGKDFTNEELQEFDLKNVLGAPCLLTVGTTDKGKAKVLSIASLPKQMKASVPKEPVFQLINFSLDEFDAATYEKLPKKIKELIAQSPEYAQAAGELPVDEPVEPEGAQEEEENLPF